MATRGGRKIQRTLREMQQIDAANLFLREAPRLVRNLKQYTPIRKQTTLKGKKEPAAGGTYRAANFKVKRLRRFGQLLLIGYFKKQRLSKYVGIEFGNKRIRPHAPLRRLLGDDIQVALRGFGTTLAKRLAEKQRRAGAK